MKIPTVLLAVAVGLALLAGCTMTVDPNFQAQAQSQMVEPEAAHWKTWVLESSDALRPDAPPDHAATLDEIAQMKELAGQRGAEAEAQIAYWDAGWPSYRWTQIATDQLVANPVGGPIRTYRASSLVNVAIYDAIVAAWDAKYAYNRPRPSAVDPTLTPLVEAPNSPSYPSEHAAAAGAAAAVLSYFYPDEADAFAAKAEEAARSRVLAGVQYPSDAEAGLELGRQVGEQVIARAMADGSDAEWDGTRPTGPGYWAGEELAEPMAGTWQAWVLASGDALRPPPPYAYDSPELAAQLQEIKDIAHDWVMDSNITWWHTDASDNVFTDFASRHIFEHHLDTNPPQAARIYALASIARSDALIACWDAKYTYWAIRPYEIDPSIPTFFPLPRHPSYPSGHACASGAIAATLAHLFPEDADYINGMAENAGESRIQGGIHYRQDVEVGLDLGRKVAELLMERDQEMTQQ